MASRRATSPPAAFRSVALRMSGMRKHRRTIRPPRDRSGDGAHQCAASRRSARPPPARPGARSAHPSAGPGACVTHIVGDIRGEHLMQGAVSGNHTRDRLLSRPGGRYQINSGQVPSELKFLFRVFCQRPKLFESDNVVACWVHQNPLIADDAEEILDATGASACLDLGRSLGILCPGAQLHPLHFSAVPRVAVQVVDQG